MSTKNVPVRGYKVFTSDWRCNGKRFKVGETYTVGGKLELCRRGLHFCKQLACCFKYKYYSHRVVVAEVEAQGKVVEGTDKCCTSKLYVVRRIPLEEVWKALNMYNDNKGISNTGHSNDGGFNTGNRNSGNFNSGHENYGECNTGSCNYGSNNVGHKNHGDGNVGDSNIGDINNGLYNIGDGNSGTNNIGDSNTGVVNIGHRNTGCWNVGSFHSGYFNTGKGQRFMFNKPVPYSVIAHVVFPCFIHDVKFVRYRYWERMTASERKKHPRAKITGGYLKRISAKTAWKEALEHAQQSKFWEEDRERLLNLPNFDFEIFEEITGLTKAQIMKEVKK